MTIAPRHVFELDSGFIEMNTISLIILAVMFGSAQQRTHMSIRINCRG